jgi:glucosyl-3-phosphoglycerate synthase
MEYVQERIATLHDYDGTVPAAPSDRAAVVVPMTGADIETPAVNHVFSTLERVTPDRVIVALRAESDSVRAAARWLEAFDLDLELLWCNAPAVDAALATHGLDGPAGKGRDVWLALGLGASSEYVVVHDADATSYAVEDVAKLLFPLTQGYTFTKGYYARVEDRHLFGRLFRLFVRPMLDTVADITDHPLAEYLRAFRYALAGEFAVTSDVARSLRIQRGWGLEVGTLGDAFELAGFADSAQVDLGRHEHDHRAVGGSDGLGEMCREVGEALFRCFADQGIDLPYDQLSDRYRDRATAMIEQYAADAAFNGFEFDHAAERAQIETYAETVTEPGRDQRLPAWEQCSLDPATVASEAREAVAARCRP